MPRIVPERPKRMFRGSEYTRLMSMIFMLVVLGMMIRTASNPDTWKWLVSDPNKGDRVIAEGDSNEKPKTDQVAAKDSPAAPAAAQPDKSADDKTPAAAKSPPPAKWATASDYSAPNTQTKTEPSTAQTTESNAAAPSALTFGSFQKASTEQKTESKAAAPVNLAATPGIQPSPPAPTIPEATGPTDEDDEEATGAREDFDAINDGLERIELQEMPAYRRLVRWVIDQPYQRLAARATQKNPTYGQFINDPNDFRQPGKIFQFDIHVREVIKFDNKMNFTENDGDDTARPPAALYEIWGTTDESRGRFVNLVVYDPPVGLPIGSSVREDVRFVGYFFRVQAYVPAKAKLGSQPLYAPSFVGRIAWKARAPGVVVETAELPWLFLVGGVTLAAVSIWVGVIVLGKKRRSVAQFATDLPPPPTMMVEDWLDQTDFDGGDDEESDSNSDLSGDDRDFGLPRRNGHLDSPSRRFEG